MGITDLTMTSERESGVDFTIPFMSLGKSTYMYFILQSKCLIQYILIKKNI